MDSNRVPRTPLIRKVLAVVTEVRPARLGWEAALAIQLWDEFYTRSGEGGPDSPQAQIQALWARLLALEEVEPDSRSRDKGDRREVSPGIRAPSGLEAARLDRILGHVAVTCEPRDEAWSEHLAAAFRPILFGEHLALDQGGGSIASLLEPLCLRLTREELRRSASIGVARPGLRWDRGRR